MNEVVEPLTGSSVIEEPGSPDGNGFGVAPNGEPMDENGALANGFKPGYGPNSAMPRMEKPVKPKMSERLKRSFGGEDKKKRKRNLIIAGVIVLVVGVAATIPLFVGAFDTDYSAAYFAAKEVRSDIQKVKSDTSCDKAIEYVDNSYITMQIYTNYVEKCRAIGEGLDVSMLAALGETEGVMRDAGVRRQYRTFKEELEETGNDKSSINAALDAYLTWHKWIVEESAGETKYATLEWTDTDLKKTSEILTKSENAKFRKYGKEWLEKMTEIADLSYSYYHITSGDTIFSMAELKDKRDKAVAEFADWKEKNEPKVTKVVPLAKIDVGKLYKKFNDLYDYIRKTYQEHYNAKAGGCKETLKSIICD